MNKKIPKFKSDDDEREFWATHDSSEYIDWKRAKRIVLPELKPSLKTISLRLPESMIEELKLLAHKKDVPEWELASKGGKGHEVCHLQTRRDVSRQGNCHF